MTGGSTGDDGIDINAEDAGAETTLGGDDESGDDVDNGAAVCGGVEGTPLTLNTARTNPFPSGPMNNAISR